MHNTIYSIQWNTVIHNAHTHTHTHTLNNSISRGNYRTDRQNISHRLYYVNMTCRDWLSRIIIVFNDFVFVHTKYINIATIRLRTVLLRTIVRFSENYRNIAPASMPLVRRRTFASYLGTPSLK